MSDTSKETLTIKPDPSGIRIVSVGDRYAELTTDECLWAVATWLMGYPTTWMKTKAEHDAQRAEWKRKFSETLNEPSQKGPRQ